MSSRRRRSRRKDTRTLLGCLGFIVLAILLGLGSCTAVVANRASDAPGLPAPTAPTGQATEDPAQQVEREAVEVTFAECEDTARAWTTTALDGTLDADVWADQMTVLTHPDTVPALAGIDRDSLPEATVSDVNAATRGESCETTVTLSDGAVLYMLVGTYGGDPVVLGWGTT